MKRHGFTLAEILIAIGIIGIVAAITAPAINNLVPDKRKAQVLKAYKTVSDITTTLLGDTGFYYGESKSYPEVKCYGIACDAKPFVNEFKAFEGTSKFAQLFMSQLDIVAEDDLTDAEKENYPTVIEGADVSFMTRDGLYWRLNAPTYTLINPGSANEYYSANISVKIDITDDCTHGDSAETDCSYNPTDYPKPTQFKFVINNNGKITGDDELTKVFLERKSELTGTKADYKEAKVRWTASQPKKNGGGDLAQ